jgi:hypothetical protein
MLVYTVNTDWEAKLYYGLILIWEYDNITVDKSPPHFCHTPATRIQNSPHAQIQPQYGAHQQLSMHPDNTKKLGAAAIVRLQEIIGVVLCYG